MKHHRNLGFVEEVPKVATVNSQVAEAPGKGCRKNL
jgi:hypothetical protein